MPTVGKPQLIFSSDYLVLPILCKWGMICRKNLLRFLQNDYSSQPSLWVIYIDTAYYYLARFRDTQSAPELWNVSSSRSPLRPVATSLDPSKGRCCAEILFDGSRTACLKQAR
jgi:hypothetical protein